MANFFNKKHEVMDIQLTQYGKFKYSQGDFNPAFYSFYDTDIDYDGVYAGISNEEQNDVLTRIKGNVSTKPMYKFVGTVGGILLNPDGSPQNNMLPYGSLGNEPEITRHIYKKPLGNSDLLKDKAPAWAVVPILDSQRISGSIVYQGSGSAYNLNNNDTLTLSGQTGADSDALNVSDTTNVVVGMSVRGPGLRTGTTVTAVVNATTLTISKKAKYQSAANSQYNFGTIVWYDQMIPKLEFDLNNTYSYDGDSLQNSIDVRLTEEQNITLQVEEKNVLDKRIANFEVEVFRLNDDDTIHSQLQFVNRNLIDKETLLNLLGQDESELAEGFPSINKTMVEYWLDIRLDDEIIKREFIDTTGLYDKTSSPSGSICD
tara:strand:- start:11757 stop:12875 length:1119 start_codon:yes stop_codon:yes gene_type:complete